MRPNRGGRYRVCMDWTADVSAGDWIAERIDDPWRGTIHDVVPRGFPAYARVLHPVTRERPVGREWPADDDPSAWEAFLAEAREVDVAPVTWGEVAEAFGTRMHPLAQWGRLVGSDPHANRYGSPRDADGWRYDEPREGQLEPEAWTALARALTRHSAGEDAFLAVWAGWGGLVGGMRYGPSRVVLEADADAQHAAFLAHAARDVFNDVFRKPTWQPGTLSDEISRGPRLHLPHREFVLFRGEISELEDLHWPGRMPWRDADRAGSGLPEAESPGVVWPADRAWVVVSEVDWDSTVVGGSRELIADVLAAPGLDAVALPPDADLSWDGDRENRPVQ